ncbi:MAG: restriction endonuclease [Marinomonas sp.]|nr:restriction endonuclease [Marinomonas sp.]
MAELISLHQGNIQTLITQHIDLWTGAVKDKSSAGRGGSSKRELYGIKKLRELILELAVRGKLVAQDPSEESASAGLNAFAVEKQKAIAEKKIKKAKTSKISEMPEVSFERPIGWALPCIENIIFNSSDHIVDGPFGSKLKATEYVESGVPIIRIQNVDRNIFKNNGLQYLTPKKASELSRHDYVSGDIVLNKLGEPTGKACIVPDYMEAGIIVADIVRIRIDSPLIHPQFLVLAINAPFVAGQFDGLAKGVTRQRVNLSQVRALRIPLPPLDEQHRIVAKVDELMALCDQLEQQTESSLDAHQTLVQTLLDTLLQSADAEELEQNWQRLSAHFDLLFTTEQSIDQLKQTILQLAVMGKLVPQDPNDEPASELLKRIAAEKEELVKQKKIKKQKPLPPISDDEKPFQLPKGWEWCRLGVAIHLISGQHLKPNEYSESHLEDSVPYITGPAEFGEVHPSYNKFTVEKRAIAESQDILITCKGSGLGKLNIANCRVAISRQLMSIRAISICEEFLYLLVNSRYDYFQSKGVGIAIPGISREDVTDLITMLPPLNEQHRIVAKVDQLMALCDQLKAKLADSKTTQLNLTDALVAQAV